MNFVKHIREDGSVEFRNPDYDEIIAKGHPDVPEEERLIISDEEISRYNSTEYQRLRAPEYPPIKDQLDALWKGGEAAAEMLATIQAVKAKYPKPE